MIKVISQVMYTAICKKCGSTIGFEYRDTDYIEIGYKNGIYGIHCPICNNPIDRDTAIKQDIITDIMHADE